MNNEEKILEILTQMQAAQIQTNDRLAKLEADVSGIKSDVSVLKEDVTEIKDDIKELWEDVSRISDRLGVQEKIVQKKLM